MLTSALCMSDFSIAHHMTSTIVTLDPNVPAANKTPIRRSASGILETGMETSPTLLNQSIFSSD